MHLLPDSFQRADPANVTGTDKIPHPARPGVRFRRSSARICRSSCPGKRSPIPNPKPTHIRPKLYRDPRLESRWHLAPTARGRRLRARTAIAGPENHTPELRLAMDQHDRDPGGAPKTQMHPEGCILGDPQCEVANPLRMFTAKKPLSWENQSETISITVPPGNDNFSWIHIARQGSGKLRYSRGAECSSARTFITAQITAPS